MITVNLSEIRLSDCFSFWGGAETLSIGYIDIANYRQSSISGQYGAGDLTDPRAKTQYFETEAEAQEYCLDVLKKVVQKLEADRTGDRDNSTQTN